ncbi:Type I polyketide synthase OS=Lysinibacillus sphaericus OX=1421 GN=LS41612_16945 PE=4 SV=1 [Lysinibacillus sphaericus]
MEYALTKIWDSFNIKADYVIGHSVGEYAAACYVGMLSFEDATNMIAMRSRLMVSVTPNGKMVGVL